MAKDLFWKIWLRPNALTKDVENDYTAEVSTVLHTVRNEDIAQAIVKGRSELRYDTILSILNERDAVVLDAILGGSSVQDGNVHMSPRVTGKWVGADPVFDPKEHKITVSVTPTASLRKALEERVGVQLLGKKTDGGAIIGLVTDVKTGDTTGRITSGGDIIIDGEKIKIAPEDGDGLGVFFVPKTGADIPLDFPMTENNPKRIVCRVPAAVHDGVFLLKIVTRFTSSSDYLKTPRSLVYELPLKEGLIPG
jgi:hypothetical protein